MNKVHHSDNVNHPQHYGGAIECIDYIQSVLVGCDGVAAFCLGNAIKYIHRYPKELNLDDIKKAIWYLDYLCRYYRPIDE